MAKLKDIAQYLNISVATVSRVVNNKDRVDPETRKRIEDALKKFNYIPDDNARRLKTNTSNVLGVIVPDISNPFYASVIKGMERVAARNGYSVMLCNTDGIKDREANAVRFLRRQKVAGIMTATASDDLGVSTFYAHLDCPVVFFDNAPSLDMPVNSVTIDNVRAARELVNYMIGRGHRRIYMISGPAGESSADGRLAGWRLALEAAGIAPEEGWYACGDFREESGKRIMDGFLAGGDRPTAVCVANNFMAYGAVKSIAGYGLDIPGDISLAAFDAEDATGLMRPRITTVVQPAEGIGAVAADMCLKVAAQDGVRMSGKMVLEHLFMENGTVGVCKQ